MQSHSMPTIGNAVRPVRPARPVDRCNWSLNAEELCHSLGGRRAGSNYIACCPAHSDHTPSLSIADGEDGRLLVHCFGGCTFEQVTDALRTLGLWHIGVPPYRPRASTRQTRGRQFDRDPERIAAALRIWSAAVAPADTVVERYLRDERRIKLQPNCDIRFHPSLKHASGVQLPGMVALVTDCLSGQPIGIHRTFLTNEGKKPSVTPCRMMLGNCAGGVVRLGPPSATVIIGEGIETTLSGMVGTTFTGWAALSASNLPNIRLPVSVTEVILIADGDDAGRKAVEIAAGNLARPDRAVRRVDAPEGYDLNDILTGRASQPFGLN